MDLSHAPDATSATFSHDSGGLWSAQSTSPDQNCIRKEPQHRAPTSGTNPAMDLGDTNVAMEDGGTKGNRTGSALDASSVAAALTLSQICLLAQ